MNIDIRGLKSGSLSFIDIDESINVDKFLLKNTDILGINNVSIKGNITNDYEGYHLDLKLKCNLMLPCSVTLKPVEYKIDTKIEGNSIELMEEIGIFNKNDENILDIFPIIWENILMEIPIRIVSEEAGPLQDGDGYKIVTDDKPSSGSPFDKLNELL